MSPSSVGRLTPADNIHPPLKAKLDVSFVREWVRERYAKRGRSSFDPIVFVKL